MQAQTPEVSAEKATTPAEHRLVSVEQLKKIHRDLDACQKVIWLAGCRPRGYCFDPSYVTDAQERLKEIEELLEELAPAQDELMPDEVHQMAFEEGQPAENGDGYCFTAEEFDLFVERLLSRATRPAQTEQQPVAWGAFHFGGSRSGKLYSHCETEQQIDSYIADVHRSNDSITLRKAPLYDAPIAQTTPQPEQSGWISVTDRLPEPGRSHGAGVLCWREGWLQPREMKLVSNAYAKTEKGRRPRWEETKGCLAFSEPTHWMPMPAGPAQSAQGVTHGR